MVFKENRYSRQFIRDLGHGAASIVYVLAQPHLSTSKHTDNNNSNDDDNDDDDRKGQKTATKERNQNSKMEKKREKLKRIY